MYTPAVHVTLCLTGGFRESGFGRDGGKEGLFEYVKPKWQKRVYPKLSSDKAVQESFGKTTPERPLNPSKGDDHDYSHLGHALPSLVPRSDSPCKSLCVDCISSHFLLAHLNNDLRFDEIMRTNSSLFLSLFPPPFSFIFFSLLFLCTVH